MLHPPTTKEFTMMIFRYPTKKDLKEAVGQPLRYTETSMFGPEYRPDGKLAGCNRPHLTGYQREFFAEVTMVGGLISKVA
jgi:hypothetical protein